MYRLAKTSWLNLYSTDVSFLHVIITQWARERRDMCVGTKKPFSPMIHPVNICRALNSMCPRDWLGHPLICYSTLHQICCHDFCLKEHNSLSFLTSPDAARSQIICKYFARYFFTTTLWSPDNWNERAFGVFTLFGCVFALHGTYLYLRKVFLFSFNAW